MADTIGMGLQGLGQAARVAWYFGLNQAVTRRSRRVTPAPADGGQQTPSQTTRPMPSTREILADLGHLVLRDASAVRDGIYPPMLGGGSPAELLARARAMLEDLPATVQRRHARDASTVRSATKDRELPDYYAQDFHFQTGGYLTEGSAKLYDVQVETLFLGGAGAMRREALRPIAEFMRGRDQRRISLLDVACGTGRFLHDCRIAWPAMRLTGLDLSSAYLDEARHHMQGLRPACLISANAEAIPLPDASQDIVVCIFLFHELPPEVRRGVTAQMARVLKPGGLLVFIDSLQFGDRPGWDGLIEGFPMRFHEPYYRHYAIDDLTALFEGAGLQKTGHWTSYFSKVMVWQKGG